MAYDELRGRVCLANRRLGATGLVRLTWGNVSEADRGLGILAIKPSGVGYDGLEPDSIVVVSLDSHAVIEGRLRPSSDTPTHLCLYEAFPSIGGIAHTHSPCATAWAQARREIPCLGTTHADTFHGAVPVTRMPTAKEIAGDYETATGLLIREVFTRSGADPAAVPGVLVAGHGPFAWGADAEAALDRAIAMEEIARIALHTLAIRPDVPTLPRELMEKHYGRKHGTGAYYGQSE